MLSALRDRPDNLTGKCADCQYKNLCRGGSRLRALGVEDDLFAPDPQCYLTETERSAEAGVDVGGADVSAD